MQPQAWLHEAQRQEDCWELTASLAPGFLREDLKEIVKRVREKNRSSSGLHMHESVHHNRAYKTHINK